MRTDGKGFRWGSLTSVWERWSPPARLHEWTAGRWFQRLVPTFAKCPIGKAMVMSKTAAETKGKKRRVKVQFTFFCPKMSDDSCYLQKSLPLHSRGIFLTGRSLDTSREFRVLAFQLRLKSSALMWVLCWSHRCVYVCVCLCSGSL